MSAVNPSNTEPEVGQSLTVTYVRAGDHILVDRRHVTIHNVEKSRLVYVPNVVRLLRVLNVHDFMDVLVHFWCLGDASLADLVGHYLDTYLPNVNDNPVDYILRSRALWTNNRIGDIETANLIALLNRMAPYNIMQALMLGQHSSLTSEVLYPLYDRIMAQAEQTYVPFVRTTAHMVSNDAPPYAPWYVTYNFREEDTLKTMTVMCGTELEAQEIAATHPDGKFLKIESFADFRPRKRHTEREWIFITADTLSSNAGRLRQLLTACNGKITLVYKRSARTEGDARRGLLVFAPLIFHPRQGITDITPELEGLEGIVVYNRRTNEGILETGIVIPRASGEAYDTALDNNLSRMAMCIAQVFDGAAEITVSVLS